MALESQRLHATEGSITSTDGTRLAFRAWPDERAAITFAVVHGLGDYSGRYERFAEGMAKYGMATYALDLRGHGHSEGQRGHVDSWSKWVDDTVAFVQHVQGAALGKEVVPVGHSFGGVAMLSTVHSGKLAGIKRFVVSSPALKLKAEVPAWKIKAASTLSRVAPKLAMDNEVDAGTISRIPEVVYAYRKDPLVHRKISSRMYTEWRRAAEDSLEHANDIQIPFLIVAGTADRLIDPAGSEELHARNARSDLKMFEGRYHEPFNDLGSDEVFAAIAEWLRKTT